MSAIAAYRQLFAYSGLSYVVFAFFGRLPLAMSQIGTLLLVQDATGSYGIGGFCAGALAVANAVGAPFFGSLADRIGQRPVALVQSLAGAVGLAAVVVLTWMDVPWPWIAVVAAAAGLAIPQVGPLARVRWRPMTAAAPNQGRLVSTAFSYEGAADEATFVLGPALVGLAIAVVSPGFAVLLAAAVLGVFGTAFALHRTAELVGRRPTDERAPGRLLTAGIIVLTVAQLTIGIIFGSVQTGNSVVANDAGQPGLTGLLHALLGVGSVVAGVAMAVIPDRFPLPRRMLVFAVALLVLSLPLLWVGSLGWLVVILIVLGFAVAPFMITNFSIAERITDPARTGAAMTLLAAATGLGYAVGAAIAGRLADSGGATPAFAVTVAAGVLAVLVSMLAGRVLRADLPG
ncbi:MFS transporter [Blastococcus sp. Marseille-P5729]|uniref:MFS transporter n=1 Tax=Blastococcus sp. Marseille-P5729 TaxID=2086582 RepID=UPI000D102D4A|nr:MFS transporter [Blastococcus sp. Marseille-P5729]